VILNLRASSLKACLIVLPDIIQKKPLEIPLRIKNAYDRVYSEYLGLNQLPNQPLSTYTELVYLAHFLKFIQLWPCGYNNTV